MKRRDNMNNDALGYMTNDDLIKIIITSLVLLFIAPYLLCIKIVEKLTKKRKITNELIEEVRQELHLQIEEARQELEVSKRLLYLRKKKHELHLLIEEARQELERIKKEMKGNEKNRIYRNRTDDRTQQ